MAGRGGISSQVFVGCRLWLPEALEGWLWAHCSVREQPGHLVYRHPALDVHHRPTPFLSPGKLGPPRPVLSTQKPKGKVLLSLRGVLQHDAWEERPVLGECCCPGCLELWPVCRAGCDPVHFFGLWPESLPVCFTNSYLESQIRLLKSQLPMGL